MQLLNDLINIESVSGREEQIQKYIYSYLKTHLLDPISIEGNTVCRVIGKDSRKTIIFNGHVDTVPVTNPEEWTKKPYGADVSAGKVYGRGASDMKGAVAAMMEMMVSLADEQPECDVFFMAVNGEETDGSGTKKCLDWFEKEWRSKYAQLAVVIGEPTGLESYVYGHRGNFFVKLITRGDTGHGSKPEKIAQHAIWKMYEAQIKVRKLAEVWAERYKHTELGSPSVGFTAISAGDMKAPNIFAPSCEATIDIRTTPTAHNYVIDELRECLTGLSEVVVSHDPFPPAFTDPNDWICQATAKASGVKGRVVGWATDMCHFSQFKIPGVIIGPGEESQLHANDEYCHIDKAERAVSVYRDIIREYGK